MTEQLPPKFKLYLEDKHVGYVWFEQKLKEIVINYSSDGIFWYSTFLIAFDEMRQLTDLQDIHGKDIAFGDKLKYIELGLIYEVVWDFHKIIGYHGEKNKMSAIYFDQMELVED